VAEPLPEVPAELLPSLGASLKGWAHMTMVASTKLPTDLQRANRIRRGALLFLNVPRKPRH